MPKDQSRFLGSARLIAVCTLGSRVTGLVRDMVVNHIFGQGWVQDAFHYGFLIPNLFRRLFGEGALSAVFVPVFTDVLSEQGRARAWTLLGRVAGLMVLVLAVLLCLVELGSLAVWAFTGGGAMRNLQVGLTAVMAPFMVGICLLALFSSMLNCLRHFTVPALLPIVLNIFIISGALLVGPMLGDQLQEQVYGLGFCVIVAGVVQLLLILPVLRQHGVRFKLSLDRDDPDVRRILRLFLPVLIGQGVLLFNVFFDAQICTLLTRGPGDPASFTLLGTTAAYPLAEGALSAVTNAQRLYQFPLGVLAISLATAALPTFSQYATDKDIGGLRSAVAQSLRLAVFVGLPSGLMLFILRQPIISLLFEHGRFGPDETARAADVLRWYGLGLTAFCCQHILLRGFYSLKDTITPMKISCWLVALNIALNLALIWTFQEQAFGISTSVTATLHVCICIWLLRRRLDGRIGATAIAISILKAIGATAAASAAAWFVHAWIAGVAFERIGLHPAGLGQKTAAVFVPLAAAIAAFFLSSLVLRMPEPRWLFARNKSVAQASRL